MGGFNSAAGPGAADTGGGDSAVFDGSGNFAAPSPLSPSGPASFGGGQLLDGLANPAGGFKLSSPVGPGATNHPTDVFKVESVLSSADMLDRPPGSVFGNDTRDAIMTAQTRLNGDSRIGLPPLKRDGLVNPAGPTEAATRRLAGEVLAGRAPTVPKPQPPKPGTAPSLAGAAQTVATPSGLRRETLEQTVRRIAAKPPLSVAAKPAMPAKSQGGQGHRRRVSQ